MASEPTTQTASAWPNLLPTEAIKAWAEISKDAPDILLQEITNDARHLRRMAWARLVAAFVLFGTSLAVSAYFLANGAGPWQAATVGGGATITVVTLLLTGRPPGPKRR